VNNSNFRNKLRFFSHGDYANVTFLFILSIIEIIFSASITIWFYLVFLNIVLILIIYFLVINYESGVRNGNINEEKFSFLKVIRFWYAVPLILTCFKEIYLILNYIKPHDIDELLIVLDWKIFGVNPTQWAYSFANPYLTEFLQVIYLFYYFMIIIYGLELYLWKRYPEYKYAMFMIVVSFWVSYIFYILLPAVGPRFTLHNFRAISHELPGVLFTEKIRDFLNFGESIPPGTLNPIEFAQRDAMPSAHVTLAILVAFLSHKIRSKSFYFYFPCCILMTISTIYLRYHYVVDIFAGIIVFLIVLVIGRVVHAQPNPLQKKDQ
jgi:membrane-associated phospholipid phosphatase